MSTKTSKGGQPSLLGSGSQAKGAKGARGKNQRKGRKPAAPVKVGKDRNWGPILMFSAVGVIAVLIIGWAFWAQRNTETLEWQERAAAIEGIINYRADQPELLTNQHRSGPLQYAMSPPVGGDHNGAWQNCQGAVYTEQIANEHAVHSLEHGAIWITYNPDLAAASDLDQLADLVEGTDKMFMSPFPGLDSPISLQAWGYQLKLDNAGDARVNEFVRALRVNASLEGPTALCSGGVTTTGTTPVG